MTLATAKKLYAHFLETNQLSHADELVGKHPELAEKPSESKKPISKPKLKEKE